jgi:hypothetical protein
LPKAATRFFDFAQNDEKTRLPKQLLRAMPHAEVALSAARILRAIPATGVLPVRLKAV